MSANLIQLPPPIPRDLEPNPPDAESLLSVAQRYLRILYRRKLVVAIVLAATVGAGFLWLQKQTPIYRATAQVMIDTDPPKVFWNVKDVVELGSPKHYRGSITYFETQYRIINSVPVAELVLNREGLWQSEHLLGLDDPDSPLTAEEKAEALSKANMGALLAGRINVRPVPNSMLVNIDFEDRDKAFAKRIVDAVAFAYQDYNLLHKRKIVGDALKELTKSVDSHADEVTAAEEALLGYEANHHVGSIEAKQKAVDERVLQLNLDLTKTRSELVRLRAKSASLREYNDVTDPFSVQAADILDNDVIRTLKGRLAEVKAEYEMLNARYLDKHPDVVAKKRELRVLTGIARREIQNLAKSVQRRLSEYRSIATGLENELDIARADQQLIGTLSLQYKRLSTESERLRTDYARVRQRLTETEMSSQFEANNVRVLESAVMPTTPVSPRRGIVLIGSVLLGLLLAFGAAIVAEYADATITDWSNLEERTGYKVLGVVPMIGNRTIARSAMSPEDYRERDLFIHEHPNSHIAEASRTLRTNLLFMARARDVKTLLITSANPVEGKSLLSSTTAISMASSGQRVLLVEADMRRPRLGISFNLDSNKGLSNCLVSEGPIWSHIQATGVDNLDVMLSGQVPPNPTELLHTPRFNEMLREARAMYDVVIFDSPPLLPVADAMVLSQRLDGTIVVVRAGKTSRHTLNHALRRLQTVEADILGIVMNYQLRKKAGQSYGYGYGYKAEDDSVKATG